MNKLLQKPSILLIYILPYLNYKDLIRLQITHDMRKLTEFYWREVVHIFPKSYIISCPTYIQNILKFICKVSFSDTEIKLHKFKNINDTYIKYDEFYRKFHIKNKK